MNDSIAQDIDTVSSVLIDIVDKIPFDGGWDAAKVITLVVAASIGGYGLFKYFKGRYKK